MWNNEINDRVNGVTLFVIIFNYIYIILYYLSINLYYLSIIDKLFYIICVLNALFVLLSICRVFEGTHPVCRQDGGAGSQWTCLRVV
jgi:hypothetical protein